MKRVVVTGMGIVSPIGNSVDEFCGNLKKGVIGFGEFTKIQPFGGITVSAEIKNFDSSKYLSPKDLKRYDLYTQYAICAAGEAVDMSGISDCEDLNPRRFGVMIGSGIGGLCTQEEEIKKYYEKGKVSPLYIPSSLINIAAGSVAIHYKAKGVCMAVVTACATGTSAIGEAFRNIKHGYSDVILAGGSEAGMTNSSIAGFNALKTLSTAEDVNRASIPYDKERTGFVLGEGAGILVLEEYEHAKRRNAPIFAEIVGYGTNCDAYHMTAPDPDGAGAKDAMLDAIAEAGINPSDIDYVNSHGTSTPLNDAAETNAIKSTFGEHSKQPYVSSTKSMTGHLMGAAGGAEGVAVVLALKNGFIPPNVGYKVPDPDCDLNLALETIEKPITYALSNSLGFGGHNAVICVKRWE